MSLELQILGSNSAAFAHRRHHTSQLLKIRNHYFLIDCGEGNQLLLKKYKVKLFRINYIVISHLHGDHYFGLIGLLSTMHLFGRQREIILIAPPGLAEIITLQLRHSQTWLNYKIKFVEWTPGEVQLVFENDLLTIHTIPMDHTVPCSGYLFREKKNKRRRLNKSVLLKNKLSPLEIQQLKDGKDVISADGSVKYESRLMTLDPISTCSYAFCSDTRYKPEIVEQISRVDLLYHEATFADDMKDRAHQTFHSTAKEAATIAKKAEVGKLLLGHFSARYQNLDSLLSEAQSIFLNSELATEGMKFNVHGK